MGIVGDTVEKCIGDASRSDMTNQKNRQPQSERYSQKLGRRQPKSAALVQTVNCKRNVCETCAIQNDGAWPAMPNEDR